MAEQPQLFEVPTIERRLGPIERAVVDGDDVEAINAVLAKCARAMDESDSARDVKALALTVIDGISKRREIGGGRDPDESEVKTPLKVVSDERARRFG